MLKLTNVSKTYVTKSKQKVDALKGVSFELADTGMVFVLGKSGSGKSTLLNLLGGLDKPTNGEIVVDGVSTKDFKQADFDSYRNGYVGFVFQEYNLLDDFNVEENVALALQLAKGNDIHQKVVNALEQVELPASYLTRRVGELSGGEKQRIAIARTIVKESKMILADEPTGNLDSATGESIWTILKNLSKDKLVVVVSHDRESAEKYADRIIEIADGAVISDSGEQPVEDVTVSHVLTTQKKRLSFKTCFKMAFNNMRHRKVRAICAVLLSVVTILALLVTQISLSFTPERTIARLIKQNDVQYITVAQRKDANDTNPNSHNIYSTARLKKKGLDYIKENSTCIVSNYVDSKQDILDLGLTFVGEAMELEPNSYYVTKEYFKRAINGWGGYILIDDKKVDIRELEDNSAEFFVGKKVVLSDLRSYFNLHENGVSTDDYPTFCGVIDTDKLNELSYDSIPEIFVTRDIAVGKGTSTTARYNDSDKIDITMDFGKYPYSNKFNITCNNPMFSYTSALLTVDGLKRIPTFVEKPEKEREIYLTFDLYAQLFGGVMTDFVDSKLTKVVKIPEGLGKAYPMKFYDYSSGDLCGDAGEFTIAGIIFTTDPDPASARTANTIVLNLKSKLLMEQAIAFDKPITIRTDSVKDMAKFLKTLRYKHSITVVRLGYIPSTFGSRGGTFNSYTEPIYAFEDNVTALQRIFVIICAALVVALVLMVINMISFSITNRKREIGILSALGTSNKDITWIFLLETLLIAILCFVLGLTAILITQPVINIKYSVEYPYVLPYFNVDLVTVAVLVVASFGLLMLAALIPTRKIAKLKPIDAIRNT